MSKKIRLLERGGNIDVFVVVAFVHCMKKQMSAEQEMNY